jgi:SAM-dependent methyltransferase
VETLDRLAPSVRRAGHRAVQALPPAAQQQVRRAGRRGFRALPPNAQQKVRELWGRPGGRPATPGTSPAAPSAAPNGPRSASAGGVRRIPLDRLDAELAEAARLFSVSEDQARHFLDHFEVALPLDAPTDPFSADYREWTWDLYRRISGRAAYELDNEASPFDLEVAKARPYPFQTESAATVAHDLQARSRLIGSIGEATSDGLAPPARLVEFGPGWGNLTNDLAATGFQITAVEVDDQFCTLIQERCAVPANLRIVKSDMLAFETAEPYDAAIFFESFHHCADHLAMLRRLHQIVRPGGLVFFASEPIAPFAYPWGPRLDGLSAWSSRTYGWLELGFETRYFDAALARTGWAADRQRSGPGDSPMDVYVARADPGWSG